MAALAASVIASDQISSSIAALDAIRERIEEPADWTPGYIAVERMVDCILPPTKGSPPLENGVARSTDGTIMVATNVEFQDVDTAALAWWFGEGCPSTEEYLRWHPKDHVSATWYTPMPAASSSNREPWVGREHRVVEALGADFGGRPQSLRIKFCSPDEYGVDEALLKEADVDVALTARVCVRDPVLGWLDVGHFIHFTRPLPNGRNGFELASRFWIGDDIAVDAQGSWWLKTVVAPLVSRVANNNIMRNVAARMLEGRTPLSLACANWRHATEEFSILSSFVQGAYEASREKGGRA
mmetsp:Transcript_35401/g.61163  ORF Transcript_35401/g.61163 Transcript_35401/m.61163 type:complete len:298 (+) Transcript_35401:217-1110(+)